ncbi:MAG: fatty acid desaturase [Granulosicoccus sp.]|jgi:fatty acid desaturase
MNWHLEHHMYAAVPCYNSNKLHHILATDMPTPNTLLGAWKETRETWQWQIINPDYAFDTPLPLPLPLPLPVPVPENDKAMSSTIC